MTTAGVVTTGGVDIDKGECGAELIELYVEYALRDATVDGVLEKGIVGSASRLRFDFERDKRSFAASGPSCSAS